MRVLGIIPARGGSKGIPQKNSKLLGGKPLLYYTFEAAKEASSITRLIFSSEDDTLIKLARAMNVEVPFKRPALLSGDTSGSLEVVQHALKFLESQGEHFDLVCLLQVTTPFRTAKEINAAIERCIALDCDSLISVQKVPHQYNPHWVFMEQEGYLNIATGDDQIIGRRQDLPVAYIRDGAIYITKTEVILKQNSFFGNRTSFIELDSSRHVNIDTAADWDRAEQLCKQLFPQ